MPEGTDLRLVALQLGNSFRLLVMNAEPVNGYQKTFLMLAIAELTGSSVTKAMSLATFRPNGCLAKVDTKCGDSFLFSA